MGDEGRAPCARFNSVTRSAGRRRGRTPRGLDGRYDPGRCPLMRPRAADPYRSKSTVAALYFAQRGPIPADISSRMPILDQDDQLRLGDLARLHIGSDRKEMASPAQRRQIGAELRRIRQAVGLSGEEVAKELDWSQSKLSRIETGLSAVSPSDLVKLLALYHLPEEIRAELLALAGEGFGVDGAWIIRAGGPTRRQAEFSAMESRVRSIRQYALTIIPGQLQSYEYTYAIAFLGAGNPADVATRRMERQRLLAGREAPRCDIVLDARALIRWPPSPTDLKARQLDHFRERLRLPNLSVSIVPLDAQPHIVAWNQFVIYDFPSSPSSPSIVAVETQVTDLFLSAQADVARYEMVFERLYEVALPPSESIGYLEWLISNPMITYPRERRNL